MVFSSSRKRPLAHAKDNINITFWCMPTSLFCFCSKKKKIKMKFSLFVTLKNDYRKLINNLWDTTHSYKNYAKQFLANSLASSFRHCSGSEIENGVKVFPPTSVQFMCKFVIMCFHYSQNNFRDIGKREKEKKLWSRLCQT